MFAVSMYFSYGISHVYSMRKLLNIVKCIVQLKEVKWLCRKCSIFERVYAPKGTERCTVKNSIKENNKKSVHLH